MEKLKYILLSLLLLASLAFNACDTPAPENRDLNSDRLQDPSELLTESFPEGREKLQDELQQAQDILESKIKALESKKTGAAAEVQEKMEEQLKGLNILRKSINADLKLIGENLEDGWEEFNEYRNWEDFSKKVREKILLINRVEVDGD